MCFNETGAAYCTRAITVCHRACMRPHSYYGLEAVDEAALTAYLTKLVDDTLANCWGNRCIEYDEIQDCVTR